MRTPVPPTRGRGLLMEHAVASEPESESRSAPESVKRRPLGIDRYQLLRLGLMSLRMVRCCLVRTVGNSVIGMR
jgi:hypothetical protein